MWRRKHRDQFVKEQNLVGVRAYALWKFASDTGLHVTLILLFATLLIFFAWHFFLPDTGRDYRVEFAGLIFDVVFILIILSLYERWHERKQDIKRQEEIIEDYKRWDSDEARFRLAGAIRRLNRLGVEKLNLTGLRLSDFKFAGNGIGSLKDSIFYDGSWGEPLKSSEVNLKNVSFDWVDCTSVQFSPFNPLRGVFAEAFSFAEYADCTFFQSNLSRASFAGAKLTWSTPPKSIDDDFIEEEDGSRSPVSTGFGTFDSADLTETSFENVRFLNADFRGAENIETANFKGATGLETCFFDSKAKKNEILRAANVKTMHDQQAQVNKDA